MTPRLEKHNVFKGQNITCQYKDLSIDNLGIERKLFVLGPCLQSQIAHCNTFSWC